MPERAPSGAPSPQPNIPQPQHGLADEYAALENTLLNSTLGRWFLAEHARRNRTPEIQLLLDAMARLEAAVLRPHPPAGGEDILTELTLLSEAINQTRREIAELNPLHRFDKARARTDDAFDQIMNAAARATSAVLTAAEDIQTTSLALRERGASPELCNRLDQRTLDIHAACASQDIAWQKAAKAARMLNEADRCIRAIICAAREHGKAEATHEWSDGRKESSGFEPMPTHVEPTHFEPTHFGPNHAYRATDAIADPTAPAGSCDGATAQGLGGQRFLRPEPLSLPRLRAIKRSSLFG